MPSKRTVIKSSPSSLTRYGPDTDQGRDAQSRRRGNARFRKLQGPTTAKLARYSPDTNKESALRNKKAIGEAYQRRKREMRQTRWGSTLYT